MKLAIDLETLSLQDNAHILSIGAVFFDDSGFGEEFYVAIDIASSQGEVDISPSTLGWWLKQPNGVFPVGNTSFSDAIEKFDTFVNRIPPNDTLCVYQQGNKDSVWLENAYKYFEKTVPWSYRNVYCARTLWAHVDVPDDFVDYNGTVHNALDDAKFVAHRMMAMLG